RGGHQAGGGGGGHHRGPGPDHPDPGGPGHPRLHRGGRPGHAGGPCGHARRVAPGRRHGPARGQGLGVAGGTAVRDPGRGQGRHQAVRRPRGSAPPRAGAGGHDRGWRAGRHPRWGAGAPLGSLSRWPRRVVVPTRRTALVAALAAAVVLVVPGPIWRNLLVVNLALLAAALLDALAALSPGKLKVGRSLPPAVTLDPPPEVTWTGHHPRRRSLRGALADELAPSLRADTRRAAARIPGRGTLRASAAISRAGGRRRRG